MWDVFSFAFPFSSQARQCSAGSSQFSKRSYPSLLKKYWVLTDEWKINHKRAVHSGRLNGTDRTLHESSFCVCLYDMSFVVLQWYQCLLGMKLAAFILFNKGVQFVKKKILKVKTCYYNLKFKFRHRLWFSCSLWTKPSAGISPFWREEIKRVMGQVLREEESRRWV